MEADIRWLTAFLDFPAAEFGAEVAFWQAVTGYGRSPARGPDGEFATLVPPSGDAYLRVQRVADGPGGCHLDLHLDPGALEQAAQRAAGAGARLARRDDDGRLFVFTSPAGLGLCLAQWDGEQAVPAPLAADGGTSRADTFSVDVPPQDFERECRFWEQLTGWAARPAQVPGFRYLDQPPGLPLRLLLQRRQAAAAGERAAGHLDVGYAGAAPVLRHEALGARVAGAHHCWHVMASPAGHPYCLCAGGC